MHGTPSGYGRATFPGHLSLERWILLRAGGLAVLTARADVGRSDLSNRQVNLFSVSRRRVDAGYTVTSGNNGD